MERATPQEDRVAELARLRGAIEAAGDVVYEWDLASDAVFCDGRAEMLFGGPGAAPNSGESFNSFVHPEDLPLRLKTLADHLAHGAPYDCEYRLRGADGEFHWVHDRGAADLTTGGTALRLIGLLRLVTQRKRNEARLEYLANFDELTGHFNKLRLREALQDSLSECLRYQASGGFLVVGVDQMAMINSAYGHEIGDAVLIEAGQRLDRCLRGSDLVGRLDGDRFGVVLRRCDERRALRVAERIVHEVRDVPIETPSGPVRVTASVGIVIYPAQSRTAFDVMTKADGALTQAKRNGRNCAGVYQVSEALRRSYRASMDIGAEVQSALQEDRLSFAYQPVVAAEKHDVGFYECLLRLRREDGELVPAGQFVPAIEQLGLMRALDRKALDLAVGDLERDRAVVLALNISGLTATERSWLRALVARLKDRPQMARRLIVEITETAALQDIEESARFVRAVRELGCMVALDDFGAGYTTFRHLKALTVDVVKIDGSFVRDIHRLPQNQMFLRSLLGLARALDLLTVAECVEDASDAAFLAAEGVDFLQGYYFGEPHHEPPWRQGEAAMPSSGHLVALPGGKHVSSTG